MEVGPTIQQVFQRNLEKAFLNEFPCGNGKWRNNLKWTSDLLERTESENASKFTNEELLELTGHVIFKKDNKWSESVKDIVKKSIDDPKQDRNSLLKRFRTLRFLNENIDNIDGFIKGFHNLEELTLSANKIKSFDVDQLPPSLTVLELCGNGIENIEFLCSKPTKFTHLGLSYNHLTAIPNSIAPNRLNYLLSLDLSFNRLDDLAGTVSALKCIPKLRALVLEGNPLYLFMGYRGYVIDSLASLTSLDDSFIFPQERHQYTGMSELEGIPLNVSMMRFVIENFHSSMTPGENEAHSDEYPKTFHTYHLEIEFIEDNYILDSNVLNVEVNILSSTSLEDSSLRKVQEGEELENEKQHIMDRSGIIKSNDFELNSEQNELSFDKFVISSQPNRMIDFISRKITVRLMENIVVKSNEPKPDEDTDNILDLPSKPSKIKSKNNISGVSSSVNVKHSKKSTSNMSISAKRTHSKMKSPAPPPPKTPPKRKGKTPSPKKGDKADGGLFEWSKMSAVQGQCLVTGKSLLSSGTSVVRSDCVFSTSSDGDGNDNDIVSQTSSNVDMDVDALPQPQQETQRKSKPDNPIPIIRTTPGHDEAIMNPPHGCHGDIKPPEAELRIELVRWESTNEGREWVNKFKIQK